VTSALYEWAIYPTGITEVLLDEDDERIAFASEADASGFDAVQEALQGLSRDTLAIWGAKRDDITHSHDKTASVRRAQLVVETWQSAILPLLEEHFEASTQSPDQDESGDSDVDSNPSSDSDSPGAADSNSDPEQPIDEGAGGVHDEHPQLERSATDDPFQDVLRQPSITPDSFDENLEATPSPETSESLDAGTSAPDSDEASGSTDSDQDQPSQTPKSSDSRARALARSIEQPGTHLDSQQSGETSVEEKRDDDSIDAGQSTIGDFGAVDASHNDHEVGETTISHEGLEPDHDEREPPITSLSPDEQLDSIADPGPAHAEILDREPTEEADAYEGALEADRAAAHDEADREGIDTDALRRELEDLANQLTRDESDDQTAGGTAGGPGQLDELEIVPIADDLAPPGVWADIEDGAAQVAGTLEKQLRLDRQRGVRRGLTAGGYDTTAGHRLLIGDPRVCKVDTPGREKRYALVLVLDRSGSMRNGEPPKIEVATKALARFAVAAEGLGIDVAIVDFIDSHARLVKPFSVETRHIQATLLDTDCGGGTPLADALELASQLVEDHRDEPLIVAVTDGEPSSVDDVIQQIRASPAPICSLTIATDTQTGNLSADASELATYYEREATIYDGDQLDDRLDQFASLLVGF
jgi:uncharacterized protein YegL